MADDVGRGHDAGRALRRGHPADRLDHGQLLRPRGRGAAGHAAARRPPGEQAPHRRLSLADRPARRRAGGRCCRQAATSSRPPASMGYRPARPPTGRRLRHGQEDGRRSWSTSAWRAGASTTAAPGRRFSAEAFATSTDTVYALSKEGPGSAGPLTAAFTAGVVRAAETVAAATPPGPAGGPHDGRARRGGERLSLARAARPLQPLRVAGDPSMRSSRRGPKGSSAGAARAWGSCGRPPTSASTAEGPTRSSSWRGSPRSAVRSTW